MHAPRWARLLLVVLTCLQEVKPCSNNKCLPPIQEQTRDILQHLLVVQVHKVGIPLLRRRWRHLLLDLHMARRCRLPGLIRKLPCQLNLLPTINPLSQLRIATVLGG